MSFDLAVFFLFLGGLMALAFIGIGIIIGRLSKDENNIVDNGGHGNE